MSSVPRVVLIVFDGLRPDLVSGADMPVLSQFLAAASVFTESRCVFPSSTRTNAAALAAGAPPSRTGVVLNKVYDPRVYPDRLVHTGQHADVARAQEVYGGSFVEAPGLADVLHSAGLRYAVVSTASAGTTHLVNPRAAANAQLVLCLRDWNASTPPEAASRYLERFGPIAPEAFPNTARLEQQTSLFLDGVLRDEPPDVALLWYNEPDWTQHRHGLGSGPAQAALAALDAQLERLLERLAGRSTVVIASDHGHVTAARRCALPEQFAAAGIDATPGGACPGSLGNVSGLWLTDTPAARVREIAAWIAQQPWCGLVFADRDVAGPDPLPGGVLDRALLGNDHLRSPTLFFTLATDAGANAAGIVGGGFCAGDVALGASYHGGASPWEMHNLLALAGPRIVPGVRHPTPAAITDIVPTVLATLDLRAPQGMTGRVLGEALRDTAAPAVPPAVTVVAAAGRRVGVAAYGGAHYFLGELADDCGLAP